MASSDGTDITDITTEQLKGYYALAGKQATSAADIVRVLDVILDRDSEEDLTVTEIEDSITALRDAIAVNTKEILNLNILLARLIFILFEHGIEIDDKALLNEMKQFYKKY